MLEQRPSYDPEKTVLEEVYERASSPQAIAARNYRRAVGENELQAALEAMELEQAWDWETRASSVLKELGLGELLDRKMSELSGGEERRVALACALVDLRDVDLLVLDEPTNHLSAEGCNWLQETLEGLSDVAVLLVTHDRYFLDQVCDEILEIDGDGGTHQHQGGWSGFLQGRAQRLELKAAHVNDARVQLKRAEEWIRRGPRGRTTKNKAQIASYNEVKEKAQAVIGGNDGTPTFGGAWTRDAKIGGKGHQRLQVTGANLGLVALRNATVLRKNGEPILDGVSFEFKRGTKVGIVGPNGAGKSTMLRALAGVQALDAGERYLGEGVRMGFLTQETPQWEDPQQKVASFVAEMADEAMLSGESFFPGTADLTRQKATAVLLRSVNFAEERWQTELSMLSGGEVRRLQLLRVLSQCPNVLLLDEPTNDIDAVTVDALERLLQPWEGTVILVSHDRSLLDGVCKELVVFPQGGGAPSLWEGTHEELLQHQRAGRVAETAAEPSAPTDAASTPTRTEGELRKLRQRLKTLERTIGQTEKRLAEVNEEMVRLGGDAEKVMELHEEATKLEAKQEELMEEWETLAVELDE